MSILLIMAIIFMTLALVFYTIGVFAEKKSGSLLKWHALIFWLGFICDTSGTNIMGQISGHRSIWLIPYIIGIYIGMNG